MLRLLYLLGATYLLVGGLALLGPAPASHMPVAPALGPAGPGGWFAAMKPFCNPVEVATRLQWNAPPAGWEGQGYGAACLALAGKIGEARALITALPADARPSAASIVFNVGHPVADAGDDLAAGPMMELVLEFWPENYMALYHAGISAEATGRPDDARRHLTQFLALYSQADGWRGSARAALSRLGVEP